MADTELRRLERDSSPEGRARLLNHRVKIGTLDPFRLEQASSLGYGPARLAMPNYDLAAWESVDDISRFFKRTDRRTKVWAALGFSRHVIDLVPSDLAVFPVVLAALVPAETWLHSEGVVHLFDEALSRVRDLERHRGFKSLQRNKQAFSAARSASYAGDSINGSSQTLTTAYAAFHAMEAREGEADWQRCFLARLLLCEVQEGCFD